MKSRVLALAVLVVAVAATAGVKDPFEGDAFRALLATQGVEVQLLLERICAEEIDVGSGYQVTGPMDPFYDGHARTFFHALRVIVDHHDAADQVLSGLKAGGFASKPGVRREEPARGPLVGFRGVELQVAHDGHKRMVLIMTVHENRWLIWVRDLHVNGVVGVESKPFREYARAVSDYLYGYAYRPAGDDAVVNDCPRAVDFDLPEAADFYAPKPDYVIQGYQNYKDYLHEHEEVRTDFARGILGFVPGDSLLEAMRSSPPEKAWPNKEQPMLQHEYKKFFERGGNTNVIRTLSAGTLATLKAGEYFYCVGLSGQIRFGYEIPREEVERIETETGKKVARANHAFLFPGEPVLTAGAFFVEAGSEGPRIVEVNAHSGHYFYSNITASIREDIAERSDEYLMTLGHFFAALDRLGIAYDRVLVTKM